MLESYEEHSKYSKEQIFYFASEFDKNSDWKDCAARVAEAFKRFGFTFESMGDTTYKVNDIPVYFESRGSISHVLVFHTHSKEFQQSLKNLLENFPSSNLLFFSIKAFVDFYNENNLKLHTKKLKNIHRFGIFDNEAS